MKTFGYQDYRFNKEKFGVAEADRISNEKCEKQNLQFKDIEYHIANFSNLNYLEQLDFILHLVDSPQIDYRQYNPWIQNSKHYESIGRLMNMLSGIYKVKKLYYLYDMNNFYQFYIYHLLTSQVVYYIN